MAQFLGFNNTNESLNHVITKILVFQLPYLFLMAHDIPRHLGKRNNIVYMKKCFVHFNFQLIAGT